MLSTLSKYSLIFIGCCLLSSCYIIHYKRYVLHKSLRGDPKQSIRLDGYYYTTNEYTAYPIVKGEDGSYIKDIENPYQQKSIQALVCYPNGYLSKYVSSGMQENDVFDYTNNC